MTFDDYQAVAAKTAIYPNTYVVDDEGDYVNVPCIYPSLGMAGEAGEFSNKIKKVIRDSKGMFSQEVIKDLFDELGDVLWYVSACATDLGFSLNEVAESNNQKLLSRLHRGTLKGSGDVR